MKECRFEGSYLLVDAAGQLVQTALWREGRWIEWRGDRAEAGKSLFTGVESLLRNQKIGFGDLSGFFFCEGPGSMLGIRIAAMAIRGWQATLPSPLPVLTYRSSDILAKFLLARPVPPPFHVVSDARRNRWNVTSVSQDGTVEPLHRLTAEEVAQLPGPLFRMEELIRAEPPRAVTEILPYTLESHASLLLEPGLLRETPTAEPLVLEAPKYQTWNAERHR